MEQLKGKAIASMVLGIVSVALPWFHWVTAIISLVAGIVGLVLAVQVRKGCQEAGVKPDGISMAGLVLSIIGIVIAFIMFIVLMCAFCAAASILGAYGEALNLLS